MKVSNIFRNCLNWVIGGFFVWLVVSHTDLVQLIKSLIDVNYFWLILASVFYSLEYVLRISRWKAMLLTQNPMLSWRNCSVPLLLSYAVNAVLPFRAGDAIRCFSFNTRLGVGSGVLLATLFVERMLDFLVVLIFLGLVLSVFNFESLPFINLGMFSLILACASLVAFLLFPKLLLPLLVIIRKVIACVPSKHEAKLSLGLTNGISTLEDLSKNHTILGLIGYSLALWITEGCVFLCVAKSLPTLTHPEAAFLALPVGTLATLIPSTPGYIGTFDYFVLLSVELFNNTHAAALAYVMIIHAILLIPPMVLGVTYLLFGVKK